MQSGRLIRDTSNWNPLIYALVQDKIDLLDYLLGQSRDLPEMLALGLPQRESSNFQRSSKATFVKHHVETLSLMIENKSKHLKLLLNAYSYLYDKKVIKYLLPIAARSKFRDFALEEIFKSQFFRGVFYAEVKATGLTSQQDSFSGFYNRYLSAAVCADEYAAQKIG